jgi:PAS domain S-box-containing protein
LRNDAGAPYAVCGISTDITARKRMEATLRESEERFRQIAENLRECIWVREVSTWRLLYVNPAYERIWGRSCDSFYAQQNSWIDAIHPSDRENVRRAITLKGVHGDFEEQYRIVRPDGETRWILDRAVPIRNEAGEVYRVAGIAEDITERRMLEQEVSEVAGHEQQRISRELHDGLGQQLTGLSYLAARLARRLEGTDAESAILIRDGLKEALAEVRRVVRGLAPVELHEEGLTVALDGLARSVQSRFGIACEFYHATDVYADDHNVATQLFRIVQEAVNNAVRHASPSKVEIRLESSADHIFLSVRDDGRWLPRDVKTEGMGLRIMRYRAGMIGARLDVLAGRHQGTTVTIQLQKEHQSECEAG